MSIYVYQILYNNFRIDNFNDGKEIEKYKLNQNKNFDNLTNLKELNKIYMVNFDKTIKEDYYIDSYKIFEKYKKNDFKDKIKTKEYYIEKYDIDNFYVLSYNISLSKLKTEINKNFYKNMWNFI